jgi:predicted nucleic acid-binding protein
LARRVYWDACVFIGLISQEADKVTLCNAVWEEAKAGKTIIVTSMFTLTEVIRARCEGIVKPLPEADDKQIVDYLTQKWVERMLLDENIATFARRLLRKHPECKKPSDGIHLATALHHDVDEIHTWDGSDLLGLDGKTQKRNLGPLTICRPRVIVVAKPLPSGKPDALELDLGKA